MKTLNFVRTNNLPLLHDELMGAIPALKSIPNSNEEPGPLGLIVLEPGMGVEGRGEDIWLTVPDEADEVAITAVVQAHDHTKGQPNPRQERIQRIGEIRALGRSNWTTAQMRELVDLMAQEVAG